MTIDNNGFHEAREMWTPQLNDIIYLASYGTPDERAFYGRFGSTNANSRARVPV